MGAVYRKELRSCLRTVLGYVFIAVMLLAMGIFVTLFNLISGYAELSYSLTAMHWTLIVLIPFLTMRAVAGERHSHTDRLLYSLPLSISQIVLGKYFAMLTVFAIPTGVMCLYPLVLSFFGEVSLPAAYTALFGFFMLGAALIAVGTFISSLFENQILAAVVGILAFVAVYFFNTAAQLIPSSPLVSLTVLIVAELLASLTVALRTKSIALGAGIAGGVLAAATAAVYAADASLFADLVPQLLYKLNLFTQCNGFTYGLLDIPCTVLYLTVCAFFLFCTVRVMDKRRFV